VPHSLLLKAVAAHTSERWVLLYVARWLEAPMQMPDGTVVPRERGTPQGSPIATARSRAAACGSPASFAVAMSPACDRPESAAASTS